MYQLDTELQKQFTIFAEHSSPMINMHRRDTVYAKEQSRHWLYGLEVNRTPSIMLPDELGGGHQHFTEHEEEESDEETT
jgi:hypothetical protein